MLRKLAYQFSVYSNQFHPIKETIGSQQYNYDHNLQNYPVTIQAYLQKRWTKKEEIPGRMYIIEQIPQLEQQFKTQQLQPLQKLLDNTRLQRMHANSDINTQYIHSILFEEHFKPMMDEYTNKVLLNGSMPPLIQYDQYSTIRNKIVALYRVFFYGDELTQLEKEIEFKYLATKQKKFFRYSGSGKLRDKCVWTYSQQRRVETMLNWRARDTDLFDDFRPIYEPMDIAKKLPAYELILKLDQVSIMTKLVFHFLERPKFQHTRKRFQWVAELLFTRVMLYTNSLEFIRTMNIPPDFHIELALVNMHIWLLTDRLNTINTQESKLLARMLKEAFLRYSQQQVSKIHLRKKNEFVKDIEQYMVASRNYLEFHFNRNANTMLNNYHKIDALVWSIVFFEKVHRYSNQVYLMAEYLKSNYDYLNSVNMISFNQCNIEFDAYRMGMDYKTKILSTNPPMSEEEFSAEFHSDNPKKKYYYSQENEMIFSRIDKQQTPLLVRRIEKINEKLFYVARKYQNLDYYDHFSKHEEQMKEKQCQAKYVWGQETEQYDAVELRKIVGMRRQQ